MGVEHPPLVHQATVLAATPGEGAAALVASQVRDAAVVPALGALGPLLLLMIHLTSSSIELTRRVLHLGSRIDLGLTPAGRRIPQIPRMDL